MLLSSGNLLFTTIVLIGKNVFNFTSTFRLILSALTLKGNTVTALLIILGLLLALVGIVGCILPFIPGPSLSFLSLLALSWAYRWEPFSIRFLVIMGFLTILLTILDYVIPAGGAKKYGASRAGIWGSLGGMPLGLFFFPPWGILIGGIVGAFLGELIAGKKGNVALRASWGVFIGYVAGTALKLAFSTIVLFFYIRELF